VLRAAVLTQYRSVTDGQTDGRTDRQTERRTDGIAIANTALAIRALRASCKKIENRQFDCKTRNVHFIVLQITYLVK